MWEIKNEFSQGSHSQFFYKLIEDKISLITSDESFRAGNISKQDADQYLQVDVDMQIAEPKPQKNTEGDIFDDIE